jgi:hypothetical protein
VAASARSPTQLSMLIALLRESTGIFRILCSLHESRTIYSVNQYRKSLRLKESPCIIMSLAVRHELASMKLAAVAPRLTLTCYPLTHPVVLAMIDSATKAMAYVVTVDQKQA